MSARFGAEAHQSSLLSGAWETPWGEHSGSCTHQAPTGWILAINFPKNVWSKSAKTPAELCITETRLALAAQRLSGRQLKPSLLVTSALVNVQRGVSGKKQSPLAYLWYIAGTRFWIQRISQGKQLQLQVNSFSEGKKGEQKWGVNIPQNPFKDQRTAISEKLKDASSAVQTPRIHNKLKPSQIPSEERQGGERQPFRRALKLHLHSTAARKLWI